MSRCCGGRWASGLVGVGRATILQVVLSHRLIRQNNAFYNGEEKWAKALERASQKAECTRYIHSNLLYIYTPAALLTRCLELMQVQGRRAWGFLCRRAGRDINVYFEILLYFLQLSDQSTGSKSIYS